MMTMPWALTKTRWTPMIFEPELEMHRPEEDADEPDSEADEALNMDLPEVLDDEGRE